MVSSMNTAALDGCDGVAVQVEVTVSRGKPRFVIVGLGDVAVREARDRLPSAFTQSGFPFPEQVLVNLAPAGIRKEGSAFDLPIALGILEASRAVSLSPRRSAFASFGEIALDGGIKPVRGALALVISAVRNGIREVMVPRENATEAALVSGVSVRPVESLRDAVDHLTGAEEISPHSGKTPHQSHDQVRALPIAGQRLAKRAALIAAAGGHNLLMIGPPGCGKSLIAHQFPLLLPPMNDDERLETVQLHSIAGQPVDRLLAGIRPWRAPHHSVSDAGMIGGGVHPVRPGEISLAHRGVLFLDEFPEFRRGVLEALRAPLETGRVTITRARQILEVPAEFQLVTAMNPCPCGRLGVPGARCLCGRGAVGAYLRKLSQPILDRIDLHVFLDSVPVEKLLDSEDAGTLCAEGGRERVERTRARQMERHGRLNSRLSHDDIGKLVTLAPSSRTLIENATKAQGLSARGFVRTLRVALTIANLDGRSEVGTPDIAEALSFRAMDRLQRYADGQL